MARNRSRTSGSSNASTTCYPPDPAGLSDPSKRLRRGKPREPVADSYAAQWHVVELDGRPVVLRPKPASGESLARSRVTHILSTWNPDGAGATLEENEDRDNVLRDWLRRERLNFQSAIGLPANRTWFESEFVVEGLSDEEAVGLASRLGQAACLRWDEQGLLVLPTGAPVVVPSIRVEVVAAEWHSTCPLRRDDDPQGLCDKRGGPYGSAAIHAAVLAQGHRAVALSLLTCRPCGQGSRAIKGPAGGAIGLSPMLISSRYGGPTWRRDNYSFDVEEEQ